LKKIGNQKSVHTIKELFKFGFGISPIIARKNLAYNRQYQSTGLINGQSLPPVSEMRYGAVKIAWSGCGLIAVHNALFLLGNPQPFRDVIAWGDLKASRLFGFFGTSPRKTKRLFQKLGYNVDTVSDKSRFDTYARRADVCLFTYWNKKWSIRHGMHTVCVQYRDGFLEVYNLYNSATEAARKNSFEEWNAEGIAPVVLYCVSRPRKKL